MRIKEIILEYKRDITASKLGEKLYTKLMSEPEVWIRRGVGFDINNIDKNKVIDAILQKIEAADPTNNKQYVMWIIRVYLNTKIYLEDAITEPTMALAKFYKLTRAKKIQPPYNDINRIKDINQLEQIVSEFPDEEKVLVDKGNYEEIYRDNEIRVIVPLDETAACYYGQGTKWCTASNHNNMYDAYTENGAKLYIVLPQKPKYPGEKYQISLNDYQFMDERDEPVEFTDLLNKYPSLKLALKNEPDFDYAMAMVKTKWLFNTYSISRNLDGLEEFKNTLLITQNKETCYKFLEEFYYGNIFRNISSSSIRPTLVDDERMEQICSLAIEYRTHALKYIKNPTFNMKKLAISIDPYSIYWIKNPEKEIILLAVSLDGLVIREIPASKRLKSIKLAAVKQNGLAIEYIKNPTEEMQLLAIRQNPRAWYKISNPTPSASALFNELY